MKILKSVLWILIGVIVGAASTGSARTIQSQPVAPEHKLRWIQSGNIVGGDPSWATFLHDPVSKACWLYVYTQAESYSLAPAPEAACFSRPGFSAK